MIHFSCLVVGFMRMAVSAADISKAIPTGRGGPNLVGVAVGVSIQPDVTQ
jgi:hypothetical protein